ncbi:hypothetical protein [Pseudomonas sp. 7SR1]|uniref:hypothetical protein n=1 Tax=Pseudomonas sp. 7SR1 TaxID=1881017 RepID=UPI0009539114|nr:hypothetical protein [Pseudomonas sp. 7SR1]ROO33416.1 hypothetical protein BIV09_23830 [Pseudomonas sp. 7SR1]SIS23156.1 hypothetical protein SAMN05428955_3421 [Pseudomonas sp. 7SR1]
MSPHILIDQALESLEHPDSEPGAQAVVQNMINNMMTGELISIDEFNHYCQRLNKIVARRKES